jgi:hypothetical protein
MRGGHVKIKLCIFMLALIAIGGARSFGQKVKVGHDRATDFSTFRTYSWSEPAMPPTRPVLFEAVIARVDIELQQKGLAKVLKDGDLTLTPSGGVDFGFAREAGSPFVPTYGGPPPTLNATMWTGASGPSNVGTYVPEGALVLTFVDRLNKKVVWSGSVKQNLDVQDKTKSLALADKAVIKLLKRFPGGK